MIMTYFISIQTPRASHRGRACCEATTMLAEVIQNQTQVMAKQTDVLKQLVEAVNALSESIRSGRGKIQYGIDLSMY